ncbi:MAG: hypothetical protein ABI605_14340 [Rhizobacter sp.]
MKAAPRTTPALLKVEWPHVHSRKEHGPENLKTDLAAKKVLISKDFYSLAAGHFACLILVVRQTVPTYATWADDETLESLWFAPESGADVRLIARKQFRPQQISD